MYHGPAIRGSNMPYIPIAAAPDMADAVFIAGPCPPRPAPPCSISQVCADAQAVVPGAQEEDRPSLLVRFTPRYSYRCCKPIHLLCCLLFSGPSIPPPTRCHPHTFSAIFSSVVDDDRRSTATPSLGVPRSCAVAGLQEPERRRISVVLHAAVRCVSRICVASTTRCPALWQLHTSLIRSPAFPRRWA